MKIGEFETLMSQLNSIKLNGNEDLKLQAKRSPLKLTTIGGKATKQVTSEDVEKFLNEPRPSKAAQGLLEKSPIGLGAEPSKEDIKKMGYEFAGTSYHKGAPITYKSADGGTITVYNGEGTAEMGEDKRKIVYQKGNLIQEMYYDDNGNFKEGKILIKDNIAGFEERKISFLTENGKTSFIE